jgi:hypothetical protein
MNPRDHIVLAMLLLIGGGQPPSCMTRIVKINQKLKMGIEPDPVAKTEIPAQ